jgi:hypothetical protein
MCALALCDHVEDIGNDGGTCRYLQWWLTPRRQTWPSCIPKTLH